MRSLRLAPVLVAAVLVLLPSPASAVSTRAEYVAEVSPICTQAQREAKRNAARIKHPDPVAEIFVESAAFSKLLARTTRKISQVEPAPGDEAAVSSWIDGLRRQKQLIDRFLRTIKHGNARGAKRLQKRIGRVENDNSKAAEQLGLPACSDA